MKTIQYGLVSKLILRRISWRSYDTQPSRLVYKPVASDQVGLRRILSTTALSATFPFTGTDLPAPDGVLYGINTITRSPLVVDRFALANHNAVVFATSGAGQVLPREGGADPGDAGRHTGGRHRSRGRVRGADRSMVVAAISKTPCAAIPSFLIPEGGCAANESDRAERGVKRTNSMTTTTGTEIASSTPRRRTGRPRKTRGAPEPPATKRRRRQRLSRDALVAAWLRWWTCL